MTEHLIYGLIDPRTDEIRYVGQSSVGLIRPQQDHVAWCLKWETCLHKLGLQKGIVVLEECPAGCESESWFHETERFYIALFRALGARLTNIADGGNGGATRRGMKTPPETLEKMRIARLGRRLSDETKAKISAKRRGKSLSEEHKKKIGAAGRGRKQTIEQIAKVKASNAAYWQSERSITECEYRRNRMRRLKVWEKSPGHGG